MKNLVVLGKAVLLALAILISVVFLYALVRGGYELLSAEAVVLRAFGVFLIALSLLEVLYLLAIARIAITAPSPQSLPAE